MWMLRTTKAMQNQQPLNRCMTNATQDQHPLSRCTTNIPSQELFSLSVGLTQCWFYASANPQQSFFFLNNLCYVILSTIWLYRVGRMLGTSVRRIHVGSTNCWSSVSARPRLCSSYAVLVLCSVALCCVGPTNVILLKHLHFPSQKFLSQSIFVITDTFDCHFG